MGLNSYRKGGSRLKERLSLRRGETCRQISLYPSYLGRGKGAKGGNSLRRRQCEQSFYKEKKAIITHSGEATGGGGEYLFKKDANCGRRSVW